MSKRILNLVLYSLFFPLFLILFPKPSLAVAPDYFDIGPIIIASKTLPSYTEDSESQGYIKYRIFSGNDKEGVSQTVNFQVKKLQANSSQPSGNKYPAREFFGRDYYNLIAISSFDKFEYLPVKLATDQRIIIDEIYLNLVKNKDYLSAFEFLSGQGIGVINSGGKTSGPIYYGLRALATGASGPKIQITPADLNLSKDGNNKITFDINLGDKLASTPYVFGVTRNAGSNGRGSNIIQTLFTIKIDCPVTNINSTSPCTLSTLPNELRGSTDPLSEPSSSDPNKKVLTPTVTNNAGKIAISFIFDASKKPEGIYTAVISNTDKTIIRDQKNFTIRNKREDSLIITPSTISQAELVRNKLPLKITYPNASSKTYLLKIPSFYRTGEVYNHETPIKMDCTKITSPECSIDTEFSPQKISAGPYLIELFEEENSGPFGAIRQKLVSNGTFTVTPSSAEEIQYAEQFNKQESSCKDRCAKGGGQSCNLAGGKPVDVYFNKANNSKPEYFESGTRTPVNPEQIGVFTAIGCIPTEPSQFVNGIIRYLSLASGGIALLLMIFASLRYITAAGNPENIKKAQDQFTNAFIGLLFVLFSTLLMQIIGVDILGLPGFVK